MADRRLTALVADIERFSVHDGPGIRTVVFLKGCPLNCAWCHNPECISFEPEVLFYPEKCIGCGKCNEGCYAGARVACGREMSVDEVMKEILADRAYYGERGGVTVSGGEPLAHPTFTSALIDACHNEGITVGIETSLYRFDRELLSKCDLIMTDIKIFDSDLHERYVGVPNGDIMKNLALADELDIPIIVRTPIIREINGNRENVSSTADFLRGLKNVVAYELLTYHPLGVAKAAALGMKTYEFSAPSVNEMEELKQYADLSRQT